MKKLTYDWYFTIGMLIATAIAGIQGAIAGNQIRVFDSILLIVTSAITIGFFKVLRIKLVPSVHFTAQFFIFLALFIGKIINIYAYLPWWDTFLHAMSGGVLGLAGLVVLAILIPKATLQTLSPWFVALFVIFFGTAMAGFWEIYEFLGDLLFGFQSQGGSLSDTMIDLTMGTAGSLIIGWIAYRYQKNGKHQLIGDVLALYTE